MKQYTTGTSREVIEERCPKCGGYTVIMGRDITTGDIFCKCNEKNRTTGSVK